MAGCTSLLRLGGWTGQKSELASRRRGTAPHWWWPQFWARQPLIAIAKAESDSSESDARSTPSRKADQMPSAVGAAGRVMSPPCKATDPGCSLCAKDHTTTDHRCPVEGCRAGKGRLCPHGTAKCANCGELHGARAGARAAKREARQLARRWRSLSSPCREWEAKAPGAPESEATAAQGGGKGGMEAEAVIEPRPEEMEE